MTLFFAFVNKDIFRDGGKQCMSLSELVSDNSHMCLHIQDLFTRGNLPPPSPSFNFVLHMYIALSNYLNLGYSLCLALFLNETMLYNYIQHGCQPSWNGQDSPGMLAFVLVVLSSQNCPEIWILCSFIFYSSVIILPP